MNRISLFVFAFISLLLTLPSAYAAVEVTSNGTHRTYTFPSSTIGGTATTYGYDFPGSPRTISIPSANSPLVIDIPQRFPLASGNVLDVSARVVPNSRDTAKAISNFARGAGGAALKAAGYVYAAAEVGKALWDLCNDLGYRCSKGQDGNPVVEKSDPTVCTVAPCYQWAAYSDPTGFVYASTGSGAIVALAAAINAKGLAYRVEVGSVVSVTATGYTAQLLYYNRATNQYQSATNYQATRGASISPNPGATIPSSITELEDAIALKSGWPTSSSLPNVLDQALKSGQTMPVPAPSSVTGPAVVQGPKTTTTTPAQNGNPAKTVTTSTVTNVTYEGPRVTTNNVTTTVTQTTNNNVPETTTVTEESEPEAVPSDSVNPDLPKLYERKYPDGLTGVWTTRKAELMATPLPNLIGSLSPTIVSSNGCPQFSIPLNLGQWNWGTYALGPPCMVWDFLKVCVLLGAAFLVRALVFGG